MALEPKPEEFKNSLNRFQESMKNLSIGLEALSKCLRQNPSIGQIRWQFLIQDQEILATDIVRVGCGFQKLYLN